MNKDRSRAGCAVIRHLVNGCDEARVRGAGHELQAIADAYAIGQAEDLVADAFEGEHGESAAFYRLQAELARLRPVYAAACAEVDRAGPLLAHERRRDPLCVAVDAARGQTAEEAVAAGQPGVMLTIPRSDRRAPASLPLTTELSRREPTGPRSVCAAGTRRVVTNAAEHGGEGDDMLTTPDIRTISRLIDADLERIERDRTTAPGSARAATASESIAIDALQSLRERLQQGSKQ
jgi:hypothetical protein